MLRNLKEITKVIAEKLFDEPITQEQLEELEEIILNSLEEHNSCVLRIAKPFNTRSQERFNNSLNDYLDQTTNELHKTPFTEFCERNNLNSYKREVILTKNTLRFSEDFRKVPVPILKISLR